MTKQFEPIEIFYDYFQDAKFREMEREKLILRCRILEGHDKRFTSSGDVKDANPELIAQYEAIPIEMNFETGESIRPDYAIFTENQKQNDIVNALDKLIQAVNHCKEMGMSIYVSSLIEAMDGALYYDIYEHMLDVNHKYILECH
jgi:hypothetical protein